jgi:hypothetical protein
MAQRVLAVNTTGQDNLANGYQALQHNTAGAGNVALGSGAGRNLTTGSNNVEIANGGTAGEAGRIRIGTAGKQTAAFVAGVNGVSIPGPSQTVLVNASGQLGTATSSSAALKTDIHALGATADRVLGLRPVSYRYKTPAAQGANAPQYGLIAEQVAKQFPALVQRAADGKPSGVYYQELPVLLLAQAQQQQRRIDDKRRQINTLQSQSHHQQAQIDWLMRQARRR